MESVFNISGCAIENQVKFASCTLLGAALTWWNGQIRTLGPDAYSMTWEVLKKKMTDKYCPQGEIKKLEIELWNLKVKGNDAPTYTLNVSKLHRHTLPLYLPDPRRLDEDFLSWQRIDGSEIRTYAEKTTVKTKGEGWMISINNHGHQHQPFSSMEGSGNTNVANAQRDNRAVPKGNGCFECGAPRHFKRDCPKLKNKDGGNRNAQGWVTFLLNNYYASILFDTGADRSFLSTAFSFLIDIAPNLLENSYDVELADGKIVGINTIIRGCTLNFLNHPFNIDLMPVELGSFDRKESRLTIISCSKAQEYMAKGCQIFLAQISAKKEEDESEGKQLKDVTNVQDFFLKCFPRTCRDKNRAEETILKAILKLVKKERLLCQVFQSGILDSEATIMCDPDRLLHVVRTARRGSAIGRFFDVELSNFPLISSALPKNSKLRHHPSNLSSCVAVLDLTFECSHHVIGTSTMFIRVAILSDPRVRCALTLSRAPKSYTLQNLEKERCRWLLIRKDYPQGKLDPRDDGNLMFKWQKTIGKVTEVNEVACDVSMIWDMALLHSSSQCPMFLVVALNTSSFKLDSDPQFIATMLARAPCFMRLQLSGDKCSLSSNSLVKEITLSGSLNQFGKRRQQISKRSNHKSSKRIECLQLVAK
ncbi:putative reverse transcriptase domain-containing protein [Tanacetum coccineum]